MKNIYALLLIVLCSFVVLTSCGDDESDNTKQEQTQDKLVGVWCTSDNTNIYIVNVPSAGKCSITVYTYASGDWQSNTKNGIYTLSNDVLTFQLDGETPWSGTFALTGDNFSFNQNGEIFMFSKYDGKQETLEALKKVIEDNTLDIEPGTGIGEDNFWVDNTSVETALARTYYVARTFTKQQIDLENYFLQLHSNGNSTSIRPTDSRISSLWQNAYRAINHTNLIISHCTKEEHSEYKAQATALRAFLYYNIAMLWGNVPYFTQPLDTESSNISVPQTSAQTIYTSILSDLNSLSLQNRNTNYMLSNDALEILKKEISMTLAKTYNVNLSSTWNPIFEYSPTRNEYGEFTDKGTVIYSREYLTLLNKESTTDKDEIIKTWNYTGKEYGYLAMLKRIGKLKEVSGCKDHELVFPIPEMELKYNTSLVQNPGY